MPRKKAKPVGLEPSSMSGPASEQAANALMLMGPWGHINPPRLEGVADNHEFWEAIYNHLMGIANAEKEKAEAILDGGTGDGVCGDS